MRKIYMLFILYILSNACTIAVKSPLDLLINDVNDFDVETKSKQYPYFDIGFAGFFVWDQDSSSPNATPEDHMRARIFNVVEKRYMLRNLDFVRFVINTPEFEQEMYKIPMYLVRSSSGPLGSNKVGDRV